MPHQCTNCGRTFDDGSKEMLSGCPDCGGNKFQFHPSGSDIPDEPDPTDEPPEPPTPDSSVARTVGNAAATVRDLVSRGRGRGSSSPGHEEPPTASPDDTTAPGSTASTDGTLEDAAQANARSQVVSPEEIPTRNSWEPTNDPPAGERSIDESEPEPETEPEPQPVDGQAVTESTEERPDLSELREELNDQFESIKVLKPGHYELNLMELYDREEYIVALQEDGRYTIQVPETWHD